MSENEKKVLNDDELAAVTGGGGATGQYMSGSNYVSYINSDGTVMLLNLSQRKILVFDNDVLFGKAKNAGLVDRFADQYDPNVDYPALVEKLKNEN